MKKLYKLWCAFIHKCPKCGEHLACNDNQFAYGNWYCPNCDGDCEEIESNNIIEQYIPKSALVAEIKDLYEDIDKCIGDLVLSRSKHDQRGISDAHWKMETLMVNTKQVLSYILQHLEVKEVDLEKEYEEFVMDVPIFENFIINDTMGMKLAKHFFELGIKAQKGE